MICRNCTRENISGSAAETTTQAAAFIDQRCACAVDRDDVMVVDLPEQTRSLLSLHGLDS